jgi:hypothetical protein
MGERWATFDQMMRQLGEVRFAVDLLSEAPGGRSSPEATALAQTLERAGQAVHACLDSDEDRTLLRAWQAIARAQDALRNAQHIIGQAHASRQAARNMRSNAARQREAARRWRRAQGMGLAGPEEPPEQD